MIGRNNLIQHLCRKQAKAVRLTHLSPQEFCVITIDWKALFSFFTSSFLLKSDSEFPLIMYLALYQVSKLYSQRVAKAYNTSNGCMYLPHQCLFF